jgi:uncharacterized protein involved in response to NO
MAVSAEARLQPYAPPAWLDVRDPWRVFFPMGVVLAWSGVVHWLLFATGATDRYLSVFHATVQIQGFMTSIAVGFLYTFVPRRTGTAPPSRVEMVAGVAAPIAVTIAAWQERWAIAQALWAAGAVIVTAFVVRRLRSPGGAGRVPGVFVWVPLALLSGIAGAALVAVAAVLGPHEVPEIWQLGRGLLLQGFVSALVVGVGGTMLPALTRGEPAPGTAASPRAGVLAQAPAALLFLASFPVEVYVGPRPGLALRAAVAGGVLVSAARLWRLPSAPGLHRQFIWIAAWLLPAGYVAAAADPALRSAALHVAFIGSFALMALSVSLHVALSHGGHPERLAMRSWQVWAMGLLLLASVVFRLLAGVDPVRLQWWLAPSATCFLLGTVAWMSLVFPAIRAAGARGA